jgi:hypothetical protein
VKFFPSIRNVNRKREKKGGGDMNRWQQDSVSDPHRFYADPDPDPAFLLNADPDPTCRIYGF